MISEKVYLYCKDDLSLIENYEKAVNDTTKNWDCHHRLETDLGLSRDELKEQNKYFNVPASELIFLTPSEHHKLHSNERWRDPKEHQKQSESHKGENHHMWGKSPSEETRKKQSEKMKGKYKDENNPAYGRTWMNNGITRAYPKLREEIEHYRSLGYDFGFKLKT